MRSLSDRLWLRVARPGPDACWVWVGPRCQGYGFISHKGKSIGTHRAAWLLTRGAIPDGLVIDHLCRNRACCNPSHMELVTIGENVMRGDTIGARNALKTHCPQGHPYDETNTYVEPLGRRQCRTCRDVRRRAWRLKQKAKAKP